jgi:hypothetical protein
LSVGRHHPAAARHHEKHECNESRSKPPAIEHNRAEMTDRRGRNQIAERNAQGSAEGGHIVERHLRPVPSRKSGDDHVQNSSKVRNEPLILRRRIFGAIPSRRLTPRGRSCKLCDGRLERSDLPRKQE